MVSFNPSPSVPSPEKVLYGHFNPSSVPGSRVLPNRISPETRSLPQQAQWPKVHPTATVRTSQILGDVTVGPGAHVVNAVLRADEGTPFHIGAGSNVQDGVVLHAHSTQEPGQPNAKNQVAIPGQGQYAIYVGNGSSLAHGALVHGPAAIGDNTFVGFKATVDHAWVGSNVEIGPHAYIKDVTIPDGVAIAPDAVITRPEEVAPNLRPRKNLNPDIARINSELALTYQNGVTPQ